MKKLLLLLIIPIIVSFGCSNTIVAEFTLVKEIKENSIVIEDWGGETKEIVVPETNDYTFQINKEYFFNYEVKKSKKDVLISAELNTP
ncbi:glycosyl transferase [Solibacillus silvestris]